MIESEYIKATDLCKIRLAKTILRDVIPILDENNKDLGVALVSLSKIEDRLSSIVVCVEEV
jgi:hypothetical protein